MIVEWIGIILIISLMTWYAYNCRIKWHEGYEQYCIFYDELIDNWSPLEGMDRKLDVGCIKLPKFLNIFYKGGI